MTAPAGHPIRPQQKNADDLAQLEQSPVRFSRVAGLFRPYTGRIAVVVALIVAASGLTVAQPFLVKRTVDEAIPRQDVPLLLWLVGGMIGLAVVAQAIGVVQTLISTRVGQEIMHGLRVGVFENLQRQSLGFFTRNRGGEVQSRLVNDIAGMRSVVTTTATSIATNLTMAVATVAAMLALSPLLSLLSLVVIPPAVWLTRQVALNRRRIMTVVQQEVAGMQEMVSENLSVSGVRLSKTLGAQDRLAEEFGAVSHRLVGLEVESQLAGRWRMATMQVLFAVIPALVYLLAGLPATSSGMTIGTLIAFTTLQTQIFRPMTGLLNIGAQWVSSMALFSRIFEYLDLEPEIREPAAPRDAEIRDNTVEFAAVSYRYPGAQVAAVDGVSFTVPAGTSTAVVGHTGSGKSTLAALLARLADPTGGVVRVGGVDLREISSAERVRRVGIVSQETYLAHASVRENLLLADPHATEGRMWEALRTACVDEVIAALPEGLDTVVGARGFRFSGGEQQRISLARTLLADPEILIFDEATSALDNETEKKVQEGVDQQGVTRLVIAHRLSTVRAADRIVVLDAGRVVERGTHDELLAAGGAYAGLVRAAERGGGRLE